MLRIGIGLALLYRTLAGALAAAPAPETRPLVVDCSRTNGWIRPLHGINSGPLCYRGTVDLTAYHQELGIPLTRLHDVPWLNAEAVDIHTVFPDFRNDPDQPESYRFAATDDYIAAINNVHSGIVYRLGESIEHTMHKYFVQPPRDSEKWAAICLGIIRHYNEGWANGFHHEIEFWEIWNEPDVRPAMWTGSDEEFFRLFEVTAKKIKLAFPGVKVGGPGVGGTGEFIGDEFKPTAFLIRFLSFCRDRGVPLDFFSWHRYTSRPWDLPRRASAIRKLLDEYGFRKAQSHLNEWNYLPDDDWSPLVARGQGTLRERWYTRMSGPEGAAFGTCALTLLQDSPLDAANYYTGEVQGFGLFNFSGVPKSSYYGFKAFRQMLDTPVRLQARGAIDGELALLAGMSQERSKANVLVSTLKSPLKEYSLSVINRPWPGQTSYRVLFVDGGHSLAEVARGTLAPVETSLSIRVEGPAVVLVEMHPE